MARLRRRITNRARRYGSHIKRRFREDPFSTIVLYSVLLSLIFLVFAFRGLIFTLFVKPIGIVNPSEQETQIEETIPADEQGTDDAVIFKSSCYRWRYRFEHCRSLGARLETARRAQ